MVRILKGEEIKELDASHMAKSGQTSSELMESAAKAFCDWYLSQGYSMNSIAIWCGAGNNGGDGFAIARLLADSDCTVIVKCCFENSARFSADAKQNFERLPASVQIIQWYDQIEDTEILIDAFLGVGLKGDLREPAKNIIEKMNQTTGYKISVDMPSGLKAEEVAGGTVFCSNRTVSFAQPKLALLLPENENVMGELTILDIGIWPEVYDQFNSRFYYIGKSDISERHRTFGRFSHKGVFGKVMLIGGSGGKMGAILLAGESALKTGSGLLQLNIDPDQNTIAQLGLKEAMTTNELIPDFTGVDALGFGPGWGTKERLEKLEGALDIFTKPVVLDADALNIISENPSLLNKLPKNSILTPHLKEFDRLAGEPKDQLDRWEKAHRLSMEYSILIILKGANTMISLPDGRQLFNSTGNQWMATAGSGDVLTGMITSFLGQGYSSENAAICGVYHHGLAGEIASRSRGRGTMARDIIEAIPRSFIELGIK